jgi:hypothetical protein
LPHARKSGFSAAPFDRVFAGIAPKLTEAMLDDVPLL